MVFLLVEDCVGFIVFNIASCNEHKVLCCIKELIVSFKYMPRRGFHLHQLRSFHQQMTQMEDVFQAYMHFPLAVVCSLTSTFVSMRLLSLPNGWQGVQPAVYTHFHVVLSFVTVKSFHVPR